MRRCHVCGLGKDLCCTFLFSLGVWISGRSGFGFHVIDLIEVLTGACTISFSFSFSFVGLKSVPWFGVSKVKYKLGDLNEGD